MFNSLYLISLILALSSFWPRSADGQNRIVGGTATTIENFPYVMTIKLNGALRCGGALVAPQFVVTAAHCTQDVTMSQLRVIGGTTYLSEAGVSRRVIKMIRHPNWNANTRNNDVAVLKLGSAMTGTNIKTIPLCSSTWQVGDLVTISGFGRTTEGGNTSNQLRTVELPLMNKNTCKNRYRNQETITASMFCTHLTGKDSCQGDSGSGVIFNNQLCGVVSWGYGCARAQYPGVNTSIRRTKTFIENAIKNNS